MSEDFDFGFTLIDETELESVQTVTTEKEAHIDFLQDQVGKMYDLITPLLNNLEKNPDLDYIKWPGKDRIEKIKQFREKLDDIATSDFEDVKVSD